MDTPTKSGNYHPDLPNIPCPRNLFISLLSKNYLIALYLVEPSIFSKNWQTLLKESPIGAWNALNQAVIQYLNTRYSKQGLHIGKSETAILSLAQKISENVSKDIMEDGGSGTSNNRQMSVIEGGFDLLVEKLQIIFDLVSSQVAQMTGREVFIHVSTDRSVKQKRKLSRQASLK